jgi:hypothetical protein
MERLSLTTGISDLRCVMGEGNCTRPNDAGAGCR